MATAPKCIAMIVADHIYTETNGKRVIAGTFDNLNAPGFPALFDHRASLYLALDGVEGSTELEIQFYDERDDKVLVKAILKLTPKPNKPHCDVGVELPPLPVPHEGLFSFRALFNGIVIGKRPVTVTHVGVGDSSIVSKQGEPS